MLCLPGGLRYACIVFICPDSPFLYKIAADPIPLFWPDPLEKILKSAMLLASDLIDFSLVGFILTMYLAFVCLVAAIG